MPGIKVTIDNKRVLELLGKEVPKVMNQEANRGLTRVTNEFARQFTRAKLTGRNAPFRVKRRVRNAKTTKDRPKLTNKMRAAGFVARLINLMDFKRKRVEIRNSNPLVVIREFGGSIRPKGAKDLFIQVRPNEVARNRKIRNKKSLRENAKRRLAISNEDRGRRFQRVIVAKTRGPITFAANLGFREMFQNFRRKAVRQLQRDIVRRGIRRLQKRRGRAGQRRAA